MKKALNVILLACASIVFGSCNKFSNGEVSTKTRVLNEPFQIIEMCDDVDVILKHSNADTTAGTILITTGENLYDNISTEIEEVKKTVTHNGLTDTLSFNKLVIRNENTLSFLRPYDYILKMTVYYDTLYELDFNSNANILTDTLRGYDYWTHFSTNESINNISYDSLTANLNLYIYGGSGNYDILTNCFRLTTHYQHGTSNLTLHGLASRAETFGDYDSHGIIDGFDLEAYAYHHVTALGTNKITVRAFHQVIARNENIGHIYYVRYRKNGSYQHGHIVGGHWVIDTIDTVYICPESVTKRGAYKDSITSIYDMP